ncbi:unnamed protein product, partial [Ixodes pacificus]
MVGSERPDSRNSLVCGGGDCKGLPHKHYSLLRLVVSPATFAAPVSVASSPTRVAELASAFPCSQDRARLSSFFSAVPSRPVGAPVASRIRPGCCRAPSLPSPRSACAVTCGC